MREDAERALLSIGSQLKHFLINERRRQLRGLVRQHPYQCCGWQSDSSWVSPMTLRPLESINVSRPRSPAQQLRTSLPATANCPTSELWIVTTAVTESPRTSPVSDIRTQVVSEASFNVALKNSSSMLTSAFPLLMYHRSGPLVASNHAQPRPA